MRIIKKYDNAFTANLDKGLLESEGIQAFVMNENIAYSTVTVNTDFLAIELAVADEDYETALKILNAPMETPDGESK